MKINLEKTSKKIAVLGAGISGLSAAYWLFKEGYDVTVFDKNKEVGGSMESVFENDFLFDRGPNSGLETTPLIKKLVDEVELTDEMIYSNAEGNKRYILRNDDLHALPMSPPAFIKSKLFSGKAKLRLFAEPFISRSKDGYYQSIAEFVKRRLGTEFLDYAINPFVAGVYAGKPEELSVASAFPKLYELENKYGGLIIGTIKSIKERKQRSEKSKQDAKMFSFKNGMQTLPKAIAKKMEHSINLSSEVVSIQKNNKRFEVQYSFAGKIESKIFDIVISTIPSFLLSKILNKLDAKLTSTLDSIYYPPVLVLYLVFNKKDIKRKLDGFGFLIPEKEKKQFLGAIWNSVIFSNRSTNDTALFTLFIGGARDSEIFKLDKEIIIKNVISDRKSVV